MDSRACCFSPNSSARAAAPAMSTRRAGAPLSSNDPRALKRFTTHPHCAAGRVSATQMISATQCRSAAVGPADTARGCAGKLLKSGMHLFMRLFSATPATARATVHADWRASATAAASERATIAAAAVGTAAVAAAAFPAASHAAASARTTTVPATAQASAAHAAAASPSASRRSAIAATAIATTTERAATAAATAVAAATE